MTLSIRPRRIAARLSAALATLVLCIAPVSASPPTDPPAVSRSAVVIPRGDIELRGWFYEADSDGTAPLALLLHGFPGGPDDPLGLGTALASRGIHALAFNFSGTHQSGGDFSMKGSQLDIAAVFAFVSDPTNLDRFEIDPDRIALGGWSFGGGMAMTYASNHAKPDRVFGLAPSDSAKIARDMEANPELEALYRQAFASLGEAGTIRTFEGLDELLRDPAPWDLRLAAHRLADHRIFIASGVDDLDTSLEAEVLPFYRALKAAGNESVVLRTYSTDHSFAGATEQVATDIAAWLRAP